MFLNPIHDFLLILLLVLILYFILFLIGFLLTSFKNFKIHTFGCFLVSFLFPKLAAALCRSCHPLKCLTCISFSCPGHYDACKLFSDSIDKDKIQRYLDKLYYNSSKEIDS